MTVPARILVTGATGAVGSAVMRALRAAGHTPHGVSRRGGYKWLARFNEDGVDPEGYATRRRELIASLERVYAALDDETAFERAS